MISVAMMMLRMFCRSRKAAVHCAEREIPVRAGSGVFAGFGGSGGGSASRGWGAGCATGAGFAGGGLGGAGC